MEKRLVEPETLKRIERFQQDEITGSVLYAKIARRQKDENNKRAFEEISKAELSHYEIWKGYTGRDVAPNRFRIYGFLLMSKILGITFTLKFFERFEEIGIHGLEEIEREIPEVRGIIAEEEKHEVSLMEMVDEERLHYVGAIVLGLNDALVELTGTIAGLTFALASNRLVALSGIITGVSATLSMAASNYLAQRADGNPKALKSSAYTGIAYLMTVILIVLPYLLLPNDWYVAAFAIMITAVILVILSFNYYISVAQGTPFWKRFGEMMLISMGVAALSFAIGLAAKALLGIEVG
ncbi:MAG: VIT1/CCC1 transporter family protein [Clostridiaceae bacterium]|nr:VIT1/CCC1 transporter family protein [Feifaniaceae bacterium]